MSSPSAFIEWFRRELHAADVRFAITSGQACVHFGIQQTTKDSDWIIEPDDLSLLRSVLADAESSRRVSSVVSRHLRGTLDQAFLGNGWTSHLAMTDSDADEHHLDFFGKAPRVRELERDAVDPDYASRLLVAQMKKTDREKDWPFVFALGPAGDGDGRCARRSARPGSRLADRCLEPSSREIPCRTDSSATVARFD